MTVEFDRNFTIAQLAPLIRARRISPVELTAAVLRRIEQCQPELNAFITVTPDLAIEMARKAEREIARGRHRGPLHGIPLGLKDLFHLRGVRTTAGSKILSDYVAAENAAVVDRLVCAGAVLVGKTNLHEFAYGPTNLNPHYGPVRNPWNTGRMSGGSSGGSAAAVVAGMALAALGTDTGGSIRIPAAACGCVGLKPTYGRAPLHGVIPLASSLDHVGPLCRCVEDAALVLDEIAGADPRDPFSRGSRHPGFARDIRKGLRRVRVGVPRQYFFDRLDKAVKRNVLNALAVMEQNGAELHEVDLPAAQSTAALAADITRAEAILYHWSWLQKRADEYGPDVRLRLEGDGPVSALRYLEAQEQRRHYAAAFRRALKSVQVLVAPTLPIPAPPLEAAAVRIGRIQEDSRLALLRLTRPANLTGQPAMSVPCGFSADGLPTGLQLIARHDDEYTLVRVGHAYEQLTPWRDAVWKPAG